MICNFLQQPVPCDDDLFNEFMTMKLLQYIVSLWQPHTQRNQFLKAVWALMFPRKALTRQSVFSYESVVMKKTEYVVETVLIVNHL